MIFSYITDQMDTATVQSSYALIVTNFRGIFCTGDMVSLLHDVSAWPSITPPASPCRLISSLSTVM